jgi:hypothetical protein
MCNRCNRPCQGSCEIRCVPQAVPGFPGPQGLPGIQGPTGFQGSTGFTGATGSGATGIVGSTGMTGFQGSTGFTGATGSGATGLEGPTGLTGFIGSTGFEGATGLGATGSTGFIGSSGFQGSTGFQGVSGFVGPTGFQGSTGFQGVSGFVGPTGFQGSTGSQGSTGFQGPTGMGPMGPSGLGTFASVYNATAALFSPLNTIAATGPVVLQNIQIASVSTTIPTGQSYYGVEYVGVSATEVIIGMVTVNGTSSTSNQPTVSGNIINFNQQTGYLNALFNIVSPVAPQGRAYNITDIITFTIMYY